MNFLLSFTLAILVAFSNGHGSNEKNNKTTTMGNQDLLNDTVKLAKLFTTKRRMLQFQKIHGNNGWLNGVKNNKDPKAASMVLSALANRRWVKYASTCMSRFHSEQLCFSNNVSFYIWEKMIIDNMRKQIMGSLWDIVEKVGYKNFFEWIQMNGAKLRKF